MQEGGERPADLRWRVPENATGQGKIKGWRPLKSRRKLLGGPLKGSHYRFSRKEKVIKEMMF